MLREHRSHVTLFDKCLFNAIAVRSLSQEGQKHPRRGASPPQFCLAYRVQQLAYNSISSLLHLLYWLDMELFIHYFERLAYLSWAWGFPEVIYDIQHHTVTTISQVR